MKRLTFLLTLLSCAVTCTFIAAAHAEMVKAPAFALKDQNSDRLDLSKYRGRVVLLNFWATWCAPCRVEMPWFEEFTKRYRDRGLVVIGLSMDEDGWSAVRPVLARLKTSYPISLGTRVIARSYGVSESLPSTFVIDREGVIRSSISGFGRKEEFEKLIEQQLSR